MLENALLQTELKEEVTEEQRESFKIENLEGANWALRKLRAIETKQAEISHVAKTERDRIDTWEQSEMKDYEADKKFFEGILTKYYKEEKAKDKKFKLSTPNGKVSSRKSSTWIYQDEEKLKEYIKSSGIEAMRIKEEIDKTALKKMFKNGVNEETGEILPFVEVVESETISVKAE